MVTIKTVAERCGLSTAAVSRALNHQPGVNPERAEWVRQVAREMGYCPNAAARTLKTNRSKIIGVLYRNRLAHEFFSVVLEGLHEEAERCGYELTFLNSGTNMSYYDHARQRQCAGVVVAQGEFQSDYVLELVNSPMPTVTIEHKHPGGTTVVGDNVSALKEMVHYLYDMGHRRIAFIHGEIGQVTLERIHGFRQGCRECGLEIPEGYIRQGKYRETTQSSAVTRELLSMEDPPTCILYPDDVSYLGGMAEIERMGLSIPEDVSCMGFDGGMISQVLRPRLTTYYQDAEQMGQQAARELIRSIEGLCDDPDRTVTVAGRILPGDTVRDLNH